MNHLLCFGYGLSARTLARQLDRSQWQVTATFRDEPPGPEEHVEPLKFGDLPNASITHLLVSAPPNDAGDPVLAAYSGWIADQPSIRWTGYLSTTGVYGDRQGEWVDESSPLIPSTQRGERRLHAEQAWRSLHQQHAIGLHIFRLAGIYGPGRNQLASLLDGTAKRVVKPGQIFSRIHAEDIAGILLASVQRPNPAAAYNVCDDEPCPPQDVILYAAGLLGIEPPPEVAFEDAALSPMAKSFFAESKRVSNRRVKRELDYRLRYPTYREGLAALLKQLQR